MIAYGNIEDKNPQRDAVLFNDILGSTVGVLNQNTFNETGLTLFGEKRAANKSSATEEAGARGVGGKGRQVDATEDTTFFTGKPEVAETGYAFLFRNYRSGFGKWQSADPLGYPHGFNNFNYCNNSGALFDRLGLTPWKTMDFYDYFYTPISARAYGSRIDTDDMDLTAQILAFILTCPVLNDFQALTIPFWLEPTIAAESASRGTGTDSFLYMDFTKTACKCVACKLLR